MIRKTILAVLLLLFVYFIIPVSSAEECTSCHKIRHGLMGDLCDNCHYNTTISNGKHLHKPFSPGFVHDSFDWEGDNAHNYTGKVLSKGDPYHWNAPADVLPDSNDCVFWHIQEDEKIRKAWGNPRPLPADNSHSYKKSSECIDCHVDGQFSSFHGKEVAIIVVDILSYNIIFNGE